MFGRFLFVLLVKVDIGGEVIWGWNLEVYCCCCVKLFSWIIFEFCKEVVFCRLV